ncbi:hypothetical protein [Streptomyces sp. G45]|uniref:hypothetical protein n=1 Tax=Streptomyces sp. G45 TaxID=3406627 RepID=UPI003C209BC4
MKQYVLLSGADYKGEGVTFRVLCDNRRRRLTAANSARVPLVFTTFDLQAGEVAVTRVTYEGGRARETTTRERPFSRVTAASFERRAAPGRPVRHRFKNGQTGVMSITDVYGAIRGIGEREPGTLAEFSVFSHGWENGPILVNSDDDRTARRYVRDGVPGAPREEDIAVPPTMRDPDDKDPRPALDFVAPTMDEAALAAFRKAFAKEAVIWLWGCAHPVEVDRLLSKVERHRAYRASPLPDETPFTFTDLTEREITYLQWYLRPVVGEFPDPRAVTLRFGEIKHFLCLANQATYAAAIATAARTRTFAAPLGTGAEYEGPGLLMRVAPGHAPHARFYRVHLGRAFDPEGHGYMLFPPGTSCPRP